MANKPTGRHLSKTRLRSQWPPAIVKAMPPANALPKPTGDEVEDNISLFCRFGSLTSGEFFDQPRLS